jgi:hypothetical protein
MNILFEKNYKYIVFEPVENLKFQLKSITRTPWYDLNVNLAGSVSEDNTFELYSKFLFGLNKTFAIISGKFEANKNEQTSINITVRPRNGPLIIFYFIALLFLMELFSSLNSNPQEWPMTVGYCIVLIIFRILFHFTTQSLKNRFERIMLIHPEE